MKGIKSNMAAFSNCCVVKKNNLSAETLLQGWAKFSMKEPHVKIQNCQKATNSISQQNKF